MKIIRVIPGADYVLTVYFDNKHTVTINMEEKLHTVRFSELNNKSLFNSVKTDGRALLWPGGISVSISEIMEIIMR